MTSHSNVQSTLFADNPMQQMLRRGGRGGGGGGGGVNV